MKSTDVIPLHVADVTYPPEHPLAGQTGPVMAFVIRHPEGLVLVDTGVGFGEPWVDANYQPNARSIRDAIEFALGVDPDDLRAVVNTHLHFDHSGQNEMYPDVPIFVQETEWDVAWEKGYTIRAWIDFPGANYVKVSGDIDLAPGLRLLHTPGHSPGHQSVAVETDDGLVLIAGQAAQDARAFAAGEADAGVQRLRDMNAAFIHFSHDRAVLKRTPKP